MGRAPGEGLGLPDGHDPVPTREEGLRKRGLVYRHFEGKPPASVIDWTDELDSPNSIKRKEKPVVMATKASDDGTSCGSIARGWRVSPNIVLATGFADPGHLLIVTFMLP